MADTGSGRRAAARSAATGGAVVGSARQARGPALDRHVVPRVRAVARALCRHVVGRREHVRARDDRARGAPPPAAPRRHGRRHRRVADRRDRHERLVAAERRARAEAHGRGPPRRGASSCSPSASSRSSANRASRSRTRWRAWSETTILKSASSSCARCRRARRRVIVARTETGWGGTELSFSRTGEWLSSLNVRTGAVRLWRQDGSLQADSGIRQPARLRERRVCRRRQLVRADRVGFDQVPPAAGRHRGQSHNGILPMGIRPRRDRSSPATSLPHCPMDARAV